MKTKTFSVFAAIFISLSLFSFAPKSSAFIVLPDPNVTVDGLPVAVRYDDFYSFSTQLLTQFGYAGFAGSSGVGGLDVVLLTQAGGIDNDPVAGGFVFEDPLASVTGPVSTLSGTWGAGNAPNGPVMVDDLLDYLHNQFGASTNIPVFTFDLVEPGNAATRDLNMTAKFTVYDPATNAEIKSWSLDNTLNSIFDPAAYITVQGEISLTGISTTVYTASNTGSGSYDFLLYSETMNLSKYAGQGYEFHIFTDLKNLNGGGEESFISGAFAAKPDTKGDNTTPEPATMTLMGLGALAYGIRTRLRKK